MNKEVVVRAFAVLTQLAMLTANAANEARPKSKKGSISERIPQFVQYTYHHRSRRDSLACQGSRGGCRWLGKLIETLIRHVRKLSGILDKRKALYDTQK